LSFTNLYGGRAFMQQLRP